MQEYTHPLERVSSYEEYLEIPTFLRENELICEMCGRDNCQAYLIGHTHTFCEDCYDFCLRENKKELLGNNL